MIKQIKPAPESVSPAQAKHPAPRCNPKPHRLGKSQRVLRECVQQA